jgi:hypothetical protein
MGNFSDNNQRMLSQQVRMINGFMQIKENQKDFDRIGVGSIIAKMDTDALQQYMENVMVENQLQVEKFGEVLSSLEDMAKNLIKEEDTDTLKLVELMNEVRAAQEENPEEALEKTYQKVDQTLRDKLEQETV